MNISFKLILITVLFSIPSFGQNYIVKYQEKSIVSEEQLKELPEEIRNERIKKKFYDLTVDTNKKISYYVNDSNTKNTLIEGDTLSNVDYSGLPKVQTYVNIKTTEKFYYKDFNKSEMLFEFFNGDQLFHGKDSLQKWNWEISDETAIIQGYSCKKAIAHWLNVEFTAWFTEEIPVNAGPDKFDGLPGLILYVGTPYYEFSAVMIKEIKEDFEILKPNFENKKTYTFEEINEIIKGKIKNLKPTFSTIRDGDKIITRETIIYKN